MIIYAIFREPPTNHPPPTWSDDMSKFPVPSAAPSKCHTGEVLRSSFIGTLVRWRKVLLDSSVDPTWHEQPRKHLVQNVGNSWWSVVKNESLEGNTNFLAKSAPWNPDVNEFLRLKIVSLCFFPESDNLNINENGLVSFPPPRRTCQTRCSSKFPWVRNLLIEIWRSKADRIGTCTTVAESLNSITGLSIHKTICCDVWTQKYFTWCFSAGRRTQQQI